MHPILHQGNAKKEAFVNEWALKGFKDLVQRKLQLVIDELKTARKWNNSRKEIFIKCLTYNNLLKIT